MKKVPASGRKTYSTKLHEQITHIIFEFESFQGLEFRKTWNFVLIFYCSFDSNSTVVWCSSTIALCGSVYLLRIRLPVCGFVQNRSRESSDCLYQTLCQWSPRSLLSGSGGHRLQLSTWGYYRILHLLLGDFGSQIVYLLTLESRQHQNSQSVSTS